MRTRELLAEVDALKAEIDRLRPLPSEVERRVLAKLRLDWNYHSNAIEGNTLTHGETRAFLSEGLTANGKPLKDHLDIRGHDQLVGFLGRFVAEGEDLTEAAIREMHKILLVEPHDAEARTADGKVARKRVVPGEYKTTQNYPASASGAFAPVYATPQDVSPRMAKLVEWNRRVLADGSVHPVEHAALLHHGFLAIHPFDDGNGRLGRILLNLVLMRRGYPVVVIRNEERNPYIAALRRADSGEPEPLVAFVAGALLETQRLYLKAARGGDIEEPADIEKEVALLKRSLQAWPDRPRLGPENLERTWMKLIAPLMVRLESRVRVYDELFSERSVEVSSPADCVKCSFPIGPEGGELWIRQLAQYLKGLSNGGVVGVRFNWIALRRSRGTGIGASAGLLVELGPFDVAIRVDADADVDAMRMGYGDSATDESLDRFSNAFARHALSRIKVAVKDAGNDVIT